MRESGWNRAKCMKKALKQPDIASFMRKTSDLGGKRGKEEVKEAKKGLGAAASSLSLSLLFPYSFRATIRTCTDRLSAIFYALPTREE